MHSTHQTLLILFFVTFAAIATIIPYCNAKLILLNQYPLAKCLDGSPSGYYFVPATNTSVSNRFMVILEGGGMCTHDEGCTARSKTDLGSSKNWTRTFTWNDWSLTTSDMANPFRQWNKIWVKYCDGSIWSGARKSPSNETFNLWFNGHDTITAVFEDLAKSTTVNKTGSFITFAGGSAGGLGVFINYDYVASILESTLVGVPIGGYVPNIEWYTGKDSSTPPVDVRDPAFIHHRKLYDAYLPENCLQKVGDSNGYKCLIPRHSYKYSNRPLFIIESLTDSVVLTGFEGISRDFLFWPESIKTFVSEYGKNASENFGQVLKSTRDGMFAASCLLHCNFKLHKPLINGENAVGGLYKWIKQYMPDHHRTNKDGFLALLPNLNPQSAFKWIDRCKNEIYWPPCNSKCPLIPDIA